MSTQTETYTEESRGSLSQLLESPFLNELLSNRLAIAGLVIILGITAIGVFAKVTSMLPASVPLGGFISYDKIISTQFGSNPYLAPPSLEHPFGTDSQARDIFKRVLYGAWLAMKYGTITVAASTFLGVGLGIFAAYYGDVTDNVIMRTMDVLLAFPSLLLALALVSAFGTGMWKVVLALTLVYTPRFARVVRGAALTVLESEYIEASEAIGAKSPRVIVKHILPNCLAPITVQSTLNFGLAIIDFAALSFLGFGAAPGTPAWGMMLNRGVSNGLLTGIWWWSFFPGLFLALTVLGFNLLGDGMRDALDPRMREAID